MNNEIDLILSRIEEAISETDRKLDFVRDVLTTKGKGNKKYALSLISKAQAHMYESLYNLRKSHHE